MLSWVSWFCARGVVQLGGKGAPPLPHCLFHCWILLNFHHLPVQTCKGNIGGSWQYQDFADPCKWTVELLRGMLVHWGFPLFGFNLRSPVPQDILKQELVGGEAVLVGLFEDVTCCWVELSGVIFRLYQDPWWCVYRFFFIFLVLWIWPPICSGNSSPSILCRTWLDYGHSSLLKRDFQYKLVSLFIWLMSWKVNFQS